jgi:hypothetical protein
VSGECLQVQDGRRKVSGIPAVIFDTVSLHVMAQSAVLPSSAAGLPKVSIHSASSLAPSIGWFLTLL